MKTICVTGMDGSGKSTLAERLVREFKENYGLRAEEVSLWDVIRKLPQGTHVLQASGSQIDFYSELLCPEARLYFALHMLSQAFAMVRESKADVLILNAHWYKYFASIVVQARDHYAGTGQGPSEDQLLSVMGLLPEPDLTFFLDADPSNTKSRKPSYSGFETGFAPLRDADTFLKFQMRAYEVMSRHAKNEDWIRIDAEQEAEAVAQAVLKHPALRRLIRKPGLPRAGRGGLLPRVGAQRANTSPQRASASKRVRETDSVLRGRARV